MEINARLEEFTSLVMSCMIPGNTVFAINLRDLWLSRDNWLAFLTLLASVLENKHNRVRKLSFDGAELELNPETSLLLASALTHENNHVQVLTIGYIELETREASVTAFVSALKHPNNRLLHIDLHSSPFPLGDISSALTSPHTRLVNVNLSSPTFKFSFDDFKSLSSALASPNNRLRVLSLQLCHVTPTAMTLLAPGLTHRNCHLEVLDLHINRVECSGATTLAQILLHPNSKLKQVDLFNNSIADEGALHLALALAKCPRRLHLLLGGNNIGAAGTSSLAQACCHVKNKVTHFDLAFNFFGLGGAKAIALALTCPFNHLTTLRLALNSLGPKGAEALAKSLSHVNNRVTSLDVRANSVGIAGMKSLARALTHEHNKVVEVILSDNTIRKHGALALAECLVHVNNKVERLELHDEFEAEAWIKLVQALERSKVRRFEAVIRHGDIDGVLGEMKRVLTSPGNQLGFLELYWVQGDEFSPEARMEMIQVVQHPFCKLTTCILPRVNRTFDEVEEEVVRLRIPKLVWVLLSAKKGRGKRVAVARVPHELLRIVGSMLVG